MLLETVGSALKRELHRAETLRTVLEERAGFPERTRRSVERDRAFREQRAGVLRHPWTQPVWVWNVNLIVRTWL